MSAAVLSIGTELTRGEIVNTNASWLSAELTAAGFSVGTVEATAGVTPTPTGVTLVIGAGTGLSEASRPLCRRVPPPLA